MTAVEPSDWTKSGRFPGQAGLYRKGVKDNKCYELSSPGSSSAGENSENKLFRIKDYNSRFVWEGQEKLIKEEKYRASALCLAV